MDNQKYQVNISITNLDRNAAQRVHDFFVRELENAGLKNNVNELKIEKHNP